MLWVKGRMEPYWIHLRKCFVALWAIYNSLSVIPLTFCLTYCCPSAFAHAAPGVSQHLTSPESEFHMLRNTFSRTRQLLEMFEQRSWSEMALGKHPRHQAGDPKEGSRDKWQEWWMIRCWGRGTCQVHRLSPLWKSARNTKDSSSTENITSYWNQRLTISKCPQTQMLTHPTPKQNTVSSRSSPPMLVGIPSAPRGRWSSALKGLIPACESYLGILQDPLVGACHHGSI